MSNLQQTCKLATTGKLNINRQDTINEILHKLSVKSIDNLLPSERAIVDVIMSMPPAEPEYEELTPEEAASEIASGSTMSAWYWLDDMIQLKQIGYAICRKR